ncbi:hypothetical protein AVEN_183542-1 [Araneus ventricosus]|uniref:Uncharacterized protein n=1 Tax=Araneus ventricosus TaxID=182803 RepID=A0A4Y2FI36_ARAVE|nr:hypothetical protein AVEN_183542-1 [Araneus ventricosus]
MKAYAPLPPEVLVINSRPLTPFALAILLDISALTPATSSSWIVSSRICQYLQNAQSNYLSHSVVDATISINASSSSEMVQRILASSTASSKWLHRKRFSRLTT